jgi:phosphohistidine phosphatase
MVSLYFMRHGHAEDGFGKPDSQRQLTTEGIKRLEVAAQVINRMGAKPAHIFASPRVRARHTADIIAQPLGIPVEIRDEVNFDFSVEAIREFCIEFPEQDLMFVGHNPSMSQVLTDLTGAMVLMKKGSFARVDVYGSSPTHGNLVWLIAPKVFDALGQ